MVDKDVGYIRPDCQTLDIIEGDKFRQFVDEFAGNEDAFSGTDVGRCEIVVGISLDFLLVRSERGFCTTDLVASAKVTKFCFLHNIKVLELRRTLFVYVHDCWIIFLEMLGKNIVDVSGHVGILVEEAENLLNHGEMLFPYHDGIPVLIDFLE